MDSVSIMKRAERMGCNRSRGGFTLLEILIAIFLFALIVSAVLGVYRGTFTVMGETEIQEEIYQKARIALERITADLECAYLSEAAGISQQDPADSDKVVFHGERKDFGDLSWDELRFVSLAHLDFSEERPVAEPAEIAYYGTTGREEGILDLYRSDTSLTRERPEPGTGGVILCNGLSTVRFTYYPSGGDARDDWNSDEVPTKGKLPARVAVFLEFPNPANSERPYRFATGVAIPMGG